jgi:hypothetical protein
MFPVTPSRERIGAKAGVKPSFPEKGMWEWAETGHVLDPESSNCHEKKREAAPDHASQLKWRYFCWPFA